MIYPGFGWGYGFASIIGGIVSGFFALLMFAVAVGLIFLLVRFLLVATRAAQLYVAKNEPPRPTVPAAAAPAAPGPATTTATPSVAAPPATEPTTAKPVTTLRTPKTPPTVG
ncbi:MAG: hypothetical protein ACYCZY_08375 [Lacisediminihabitans sp.]